METVINSVFETFPFLEAFGPGIIVPLICFAIVGILAQWSLYDKCGQPGIDCIVPIRNVITFLKIVGRPAKHSVWVIVPPPVIILLLILIPNTLLSYIVAAALFIPWAMFLGKVYIELCQSFGHYKLSDYVMVILFNGFYVLHLGLSYQEKYKGPVYGHKKSETEEQLKGQLA